MEPEENSKIFVTQPLLPGLVDIYSSFEQICESKWLTNMGVRHNELEQKLVSVLKVKNVALFNNGTTALLVALKALDLPFESEVITTSFTFAATPHCISWNGLKPVFCDIEPNTMTIDVDKIEALITPKTSAILAVHVYGFPCDIEKIQAIAKKYNLKVIYDAAHAFSTEIDCKGIGSFGDITMFSFHATKLFNTIEGGCLTCNDENIAKRIRSLRDFGIESEEVVKDVGINGKMNELQASIGLLNLHLYKSEQLKREKIKQIYDKKLSAINGITIPKMPVNTSNSYQYYPILIGDEYPLTRDEVYNKFKQMNIYTRKYFYPACHDYECYKNLPHAKMPVVDDIKYRVLCLPYYGSLDTDILDKICSNLENCFALGGANET